MTAPTALQVSTASASLPRSSPRAGKAALIASAAAGISGIWAPMVEPGSAMFPGAPEVAIRRPTRSPSSCASTSTRCSLPTARGSRWSIPAGGRECFASTLTRPCSPRTWRRCPRRQQVARQAREQYGTQGVPVAELRRCEDEGRDGTRLAGCVKAYLPPPAGRFGMVLRFAVIDDQLRLAYPAFGGAPPPARLSRSNRVPTRPSATPRPAAGLGRQAPRVVPLRQELVDAAQPVAIGEIDQCLGAGAAPVDG